MMMRMVIYCEWTVKKLTIGVEVFNLPGETKRLGQMLTRMSMLLTIEVRSNQVEKKSAFDQVENLHFDQIDNTLL